MTTLMSEPDYYGPTPDDDPRGETCKATLYGHECGEQANHEALDLPHRCCLQLEPNELNTHPEDYADGICGMGWVDEGTFAFVESLSTRA